MLEREFQTWDEFKKWVAEYAVRAESSERMYLFRGQSDASWSLQASLDRHSTFPSDEARDAYELRLLTSFQREAVTLLSSSAGVPQGDELSLLARHHGLPSAWLDFTESPYVAAYFAFADAVSPATHVAIWCMIRGWLPDSSEIGCDVEIIDDAERIRFNPRALGQRGVFVRVPTARKPFVELVSASLVKMSLPVSERGVALAELDIMTINARTLFPDFDGAARAVLARISQ